MNKKKNNTTKGLVERMRLNRDKMNIDLENMTSEERSEYFKKMREKSNFSVNS